MLAAGQAVAGESLVRSVAQRGADVRCTVLDAARMAAAGLGAAGRNAGGAPAGAVQQLGERILRRRDRGDRRRAGAGGSAANEASRRMFETECCWRSARSCLRIAVLTKDCWCARRLRWLLFWPSRQQRFAVLARRLIAPAILVLIAAGLMAHYNQRVFGSALTLPYQMNRATYASAPVFLWQSPRPAPEYRSKVMHDFYQIWEMDDFRLARTLHGFVNITVQKIATAVLFFFGVALLIPLVMLPRLLRDRRMRYLLVAGAVFGLGLSVNAWFFPALCGAVHGGQFTCCCCSACATCGNAGPAVNPWGLALVRYAPLVCLMLAGLRIYAEPLGLEIHRWPSMWYGTEPLGLPRAKVAAQLEANPGKQLAIVRYTPEHAPFDDWVYNAADIDASKVVWARELRGGQQSGTVAVLPGSPGLAGRAGFRTAQSVAILTADSNPTDDSHQDQHREMRRIQKIGVDARGSILRSGRVYRQSEGGCDKRDRRSSSDARAAQSMEWSTPGTGGRSRARATGSRTRSARIGQTGPASSISRASRQRREARSTSRRGS